MTEQPAPPPENVEVRTARSGPSLSAVAVTAMTAVLCLLTILWWLEPAGGSGTQRRPIGPTAPVFDLGDKTRYDAIRERPLFIATRTPPDEPEAAPATPTPRARSNPSRDYRLQGTVVAGEGSIAVLMDTRTQKITRLRQEQEIMGWTLIEVTARTAVFERDGRRHVMALTRR